MTPELNDAILKVINGTEKVVPDTINQTLAFAKIAWIAPASLTLIFSAVTLFLSVKAQEDDFDNVGTFILTLLLSFIFIIVTIFDIFTAIKATFFPYVYLLGLLK